MHNAVPVIGDECTLLAEHPFTISYYSTRENSIAENAGNSNSVITCTTFQVEACGRSGVERCRDAGRRRTSIGYRLDGALSALRVGLVFTWLQGKVRGVPPMSIRRYSRRDWSMLLLPMNMATRVAPMIGIG